MLDYIQWLAFLRPEANILKFLFSTISVRGIYSMVKVMERFWLIETNNG